MTASRLAAARSIAFVVVLAPLACAPAPLLASGDALASIQRADAMALPHGAGAVSLTQRVGAALPLESRWVEADGRPVALGELFVPGKPVLLVLGYYSCPQLCGLLMHGVLEAVHSAGARAHDVRIVALSIDPDDTPGTASARRRTDLAYAEFLGRDASPAAPPPDLHLLVGDAAGIDLLMAAAGYRVHRNADAMRAGAARYDHPAALVVATPQGRISRYLMGVRFDASELDAAVADARAERSGGVTDRIALLCAHLDIAVGRHSAAVLQATRAVAVLVALVLAGWCWRRRGGAARRTGR